MYTSMHLYDKECESIRLIPPIIEVQYLSRCISIRSGESELCIFIYSEAIIEQLERVLQEARHEMRKREDKTKVWYPVDEQRGE